MHFAMYGAIVYRKEDCIWFW